MIIMIIQGQLDETAAKELGPGPGSMLTDAKYYAVGKSNKTIFQLFKNINQLKCSCYFIETKLHLLSAHL